MQKSAFDLIPQAVDRLAEHYRLLDTLDPLEVEAGNLLDELGDLRSAFLEHEVVSFTAHSDENSTGDNHSYSRRIEELRLQAYDSPAVALALDIHAAKSVLYNLSMPFSLRRYVADRLVDDVRPAKPANRPKVFPLRDLMIVEVIEDLVKENGLSQYGSPSNGYANSACWVVAKAQQQLGQTPNSPQTVAKILLRARKAEKLEKRAASLVNKQMMK